MDSKIVEKTPKVPKKRKMRDRTDRYYVSPKELYDEMLISKANDELTPRAVSFLIKIANEQVRKLQFKYEDDKKDVIAFAIMDFLSYWRGFDPNVSQNAFSYFTQMIKNGYAKGYKKLHPIPDSSMVSISNDNVFVNF